MKKLIAQESLKKERFGKGVLSILVSLVVFLLILQVFLANRLVEKSGSLRTLDLEIADLEARNRSLSTEIGDSRSIDRIEKAVKELGFEKTARYSLLPTQVPVAFKATQDVNLLR